MKKQYTTPETTVVAVAPVKLLETSKEIPADPGTGTGEVHSRPVVRQTTIPSDNLWEE